MASTRLRQDRDRVPTSARRIRLHREDRGSSSAALGRDHWRLRTQPSFVTGHSYVAACPSTKRSALTSDTVSDLRTSRSVSRTCPHHDRRSEPTRSWHIGSVCSLLPLTRTMSTRGHPLAIPARLSNTDKHRVIHAAETGLGLLDDDPHGHRPRVIKGVPNEDAGQILKETWRRETGLDDGDEIVRFPLAPTGPNPLVTMSWQLGISVTFGLAAGGSFLPYIRRGVDDVLEILGPEFDA